MPTFYKRKVGSVRGAWTENDLRNAVQAIREDGCSINAAANRFGVPATTIRRRLKSSCFDKKPLGPSSLLGITNEKKLVLHINKLQKSGFAPTRKEVRVMAYKLASQLKLRHNFNNELGMAGEEWLQLFLHRNPELTIRKAEAVSLPRAEVCKANVDKYFQLLEETLVNHNLLNKPGSIYNVDETGLQLNSRPGNVIAAKGSKQVANITSAEKGETISLIACCNGEGVFLPPTCIMKGKNKKPEYQDGMPPGSQIVMSQKSAYVNNDIFFEWLKTQFAPRKPQGTVLLILDGHSSHCSSTEMLEFAEKENILLLCLPSDSTHFLQPLDRSFFKSLKGHYYETCKNFTKRNPTRRLNRLIFGKLLSEAWAKAATVKNGISGFRATGIIPLNPDVIPDHFFFQQGNRQSFDTNEPRHSTQSHGSVSPIPGTSRDQMPVCTADITNASCSSTNLDRSVLTEDIVDAEDGAANIDVTPGKVLEEISPVPVIPQRVQRARKNSRALAALINSKSNIDSLRELQNAKKKTIAVRKQLPHPKPSKHRRRTVAEEESSSDSEPFVPMDEDNDISEEESYCCGCGEEYRTTTKKVDWIECCNCRKWLHEDCTKYPNYCDLCGKKSLKKK